MWRERRYLRVNIIKPPAKLGQCAAGRANGHQMNNQKAGQTWDKQTKPDVGVVGTTLNIWDIYTTCKCLFKDTNWRTTSPIFKSSSYNWSFNAHYNLVVVHNICVSEESCGTFQNPGLTVTTLMGNLNLWKVVVELIQICMLLWAIVTTNYIQIADGLALCHHQAE